MAKQKKPEFIPGVEGRPVGAAKTTLETLLLGTNQEHPLHETLKGLLAEKKIEIKEGKTSWGASHIVARRNGSSIVMELDVTPGLRNNYFSRPKTMVVTDMPKVQLSGNDVHHKRVNLTADLTSFIEKVDAMLTAQEAIDATRRDTRSIVDVALEKLVADVRAANPSYPYLKGIVSGEKATEISRVSIRVELSRTEKTFDPDLTVSADVSEDGSYTLIGAKVRGDFDLAKLIHALS